MSIHYAQLLLTRARSYLDSAKDNILKGRYDVAAVELEIAAQLAVKSLIVKLGFEPPRTHSIRQLLSFIISNRLLPEYCLREIREFVQMNREKLVLLENARTLGQYGTTQVDVEDVKPLVEITEKVLELVERYWKMVTT